MTDENLNVFPNSKSPLFGAGEVSIAQIKTAAEAGLMGDATQSAGTGVVDTQAGGPIFGVAFEKFTQHTTGSTTLSVNVTPPANSAAVITISGYAGTGGNSSGANLRRGTTFLSATSIGANTTFVDLTPGISATTYNLIVTGTAAFLVFSSISVRFIILTNNQEAFIETAAVAEKVIITPDSHTTREIAVLPA